MDLEKECCHHHTDVHHSKALKIALWVASGFMVAEVVGGWISNSLALISDALHMFTDVGALLLSLVVIRIARLPKTAVMSYGFHRAEILGALASALSLWALSLLLIYEATMRLITPEEVKGPIMLVVAIIGFGANLFMMKTLHSSQGHNLNMRAAYLHVVGDLLGSIGVIIGGVLLWLFKWYPIDPIITILFTCAILYSSGKIIKQTVLVLMESAPEGINPVEIEKDLLKIPGVEEVHDLHLWALSSKRTALSAHVVASAPHQVLQEAHSMIESKYEIHYMTLQVETPHDFQSKFCYDCEEKRPL